MMKEPIPLDTSFLYLRVTTGPTPALQQALKNATVELYELDNPAPAGDDVVIPETGESEKITQKFEITEVRTYTPAADQLLGTGLTDENGLVKFSAPTNSLGGTFQDIKTTSDVHTGEVISTQTINRQVPEKKADYGVTITASDGAVIAQRMLIALNAPGTQLGTLDNPFPVRILTSIVTVDASVYVSTPVTNARTWSSGLAPNAAGGWNYITQIYEPRHEEQPVPEWVVVNVPSGVAHPFYGIKHINANDNTRIRGQLRAANGRIFFPCALNNIAYYEPADEKIYQSLTIEDPQNHHGHPDPKIYKMVFGPDGKIYGATQTANKDYLPMVFQLDPETLAVRVLGHVGKTRQSYSFGYYLNADPPWVYVAVGETSWELAALNMDDLDQNTNMHILATLTGSTPWMELKTDQTAISATLITNYQQSHESREFHYLVDGRFSDAPTARNVTPYKNQIHQPIEIDDEDGAGHLSWRPFNSPPAAVWMDINYPVNERVPIPRVPIPIESMAMLPDGSVIGGSQDYNGFWRYRPASNSTEWYGAKSGITSQSVLAVVGDRLYISGYPNGQLFEFDWTHDWTRKVSLDPKPNPVHLGEYYPASKIKYARHLVWANGRLYAAGNRAREGQGAGIGYYDKNNESSPFTGKFANLDYLRPMGLVDIVGQIVLSGQVIQDPAQPHRDAQLVRYDYNLNEPMLTTVEPGLGDTGQLFKISDSVVMGVVQSLKLAYLFDFSTGKLKVPGLVDLGDQPEAAIQRADGSVWVALGRAIKRIDPMNLDVTTICTLSAPATTMAWVGNDLYLSIGPELRVVRSVP
jgi:hypothetical protein